MGAIMGAAGPEGSVTGGCRGQGREKGMEWEWSRGWTCCGVSEQHPL